MKPSKKKSYLGAVIATVALSISPGLHGDDLDVVGNLDVTGNVDIHGDSLTLGAWDDNSAMPGFGLLYDDGTTGSILLQASRSSAQWLFQHQASGGGWSNAFKIDATHRLILFGASPANSESIILDPIGSSSFGTSVNFLGSNNQMPNQTLASTSSILTAGLGDARYLRPGALLSGTSSHTFGVAQNPSWNGQGLTIKAGDGAAGVADRSGGSLILSSGAANGAGWGGSILLQTASNPAASGTSTRSMVTRMTIDGRTGNVGIGAGAGMGFTWANIAGNLDVSYGGAPATLVLGADLNLHTRSDATYKKFTIACPPYYNSQHAITVIGASIYSDRSELFIGGASSTQLGPTDVIIMTHLSETSANGEERMRFYRNGSITVNGNLVQNTTFRIKGNVDANLFVTSGSNDSVGVGVASPQAKLHVGGGLKVDGSASISGGINVSGSASITGPLAISGTGSLRLPDGTVLSGSNTLQSVITSGTALTISGAVSASQVTGLSPVATSGNYTSLTGLPTIPSNTNQLANGAGFITSSGTAAFAQASGTATALSGTIQAIQVAGLSGVATSGDYASLSGLPTIPTDTNQLANSAGYVTASGTTSGITLSGTTTATGSIVATGGVVVTGTAVEVTSGTTTVTKIVSSGSSQLVLIPEQGDLSMGTFTAGRIPQ